MKYLIITTSIHNRFGVIDNEKRKTRYIESIQSVLNIISSDIKPIIVENNGQRETYLDTLNCDVVYTDNNSLTDVCHKGVNELNDIKYVIQKYNIQDDDVVIKLTGRYKVLTNSFFELIKTTEFDAYVKFFNVCTTEFVYNDCVLGFFAVKCKNLNNFVYKQHAEIEFAEHIRNSVSSEKICEVQNLELECCFADNLRILVV